MDCPASVPQVQRCEQDLNAPQFMLLNFSQSPNVISTTRTISFVNNFRSVSVFVFVVKEAFDLPCLPQDYKDEIKISKVVEFCNKRLSKFFIFTTKRELDENFLSFFEEKIQNNVVIL